MHSLESPYVPIGIVTLAVVVAFALPGTAATSALLFLGKVGGLVSLVDRGTDLASEVT